MNFPFRRLAGMLMAALSAGSLVLTLFLLVQAWEVQSTLEENLLDGLDTTQALLQSTADGVLTTRLVLSDTQGTLQALVDVSMAIAASIHDVPPILEGLEKLSGTQLPQTISAAQQSLTSAQDSAGRIEAMLELVSKIPFFPGGRYEPEVPLEQALGQVARDLEGVRTPLLGLQKGLQTTQANLDTLEVELVDTANELGKVAADLEKTNRSLDTITMQINDLQDQVGKLKQVLPGWLERALWLVCFLLAWLGLGQIAWLGISLRMV